MKGCHFKEMFRHIEMKKIPKHEFVSPKTGETKTIGGYTAMVFDEKWEKKHICDCLLLFSFWQRAELVAGMQIGEFELGDCSRSESSLIKSAIYHAIENLEARLFSSDWKAKDITISRLDLRALIETALYPSSYLRDVRFDRIIEGASKGGKSHHAADRDDFKETYRMERDSRPNDSRPSIIGLLEKRESAKRSTLIKWAKEADKEDGFIRKGGRPKKGE